MPLVRRRRASVRKRSSASTTIQIQPRCVNLFNIDDGDVLLTFAHHEGPVTSLALLPDGLRFVSGSDDNTARIVYHGLAPK